MSFNAFPIPDILEQLKSPVVDDKIHDIAERKHSFNGPMNLNTGRLYKVLISAHKTNAEAAASASIQISGYTVASLSLAANATGTTVFGEIALLSSESFSKIQTINYTSRDTLASSSPLIRWIPLGEGVIDVKSLNNLEIDTFVIVEV